MESTILAADWAPSAKCHPPKVFANFDRFVLSLCDQSYELLSWFATAAESNGAEFDKETHTVRRGGWFMGERVSDARPVESECA